VKRNALFLIVFIGVSSAPNATLAEGDAKAGKDLYEVCATCHGEDARGNADTQAPQLAGQFEWYLVRQLQNFRNGIRGTHPDDTYGAMMKPMADMLKTDQAVADVAAYIATRKPTRHD